MLTWVWPIFGFLTLGMHAGCAIYFPELYPTRLRSSGAGFCFNFARSATAVMLLVNGVKSFRLPENIRAFGRSAHHAER